MKSMLILVLCCSPLVAQSFDDLHPKYGRPVSETYEIRKGIYVTANSNSAGEICDLIISRQLASETLNYPSTETMKSDELTKLIDELVPASGRGKGTLSGFVNATCLPLDNCAGVTENYERVRIFRNGGTDKERYAYIQFVKPNCNH